MCTFLGYFTYFVLMSNFSWITVFGLDLYLSIHKMVQRDPGWKQNIGLSVQLPALPIIFFLVLYVSSLSLSDGEFLISHHVALSSLVTSIFGIFLLFLDLLRNCRDEDGNRGGNINCIVGLGIPLLLTATMASLHLLLPKGSLLNPEVSFISSVFVFLNWILRLVSKTNALLLPPIQPHVSLSSTIFPYSGVTVRLSNCHSCQFLSWEFLPSHISG